MISIIIYLILFVAVLYIIGQLIKGLLVVGLVCGFIVLFVWICKEIRNHIRDKLFSEALQAMGLDNWYYLSVDDVVVVKSSKSVTEYTAIKYFKEDRARIEQVNERLKRKKQYALLLS